MGLISDDTGLIFSFGGLGEVFLFDGVNFIEVDYISQEPRMSEEESEPNQK